MLAAKVFLYTTRFCPYCVRAKQVLDSKGVNYQELAVDNDPKLRQEMMRRSGRRTVPQIWIGNKHVGGFDDLWALEQTDRLDKLLNNECELNN